MKRIINEIKKINQSKTITFSEKFYKSSDDKTVMGEVAFKEILFLDYRETEAGSNPREYNGLKKTNLNIIKSLLKDYSNMFRFLHSGIIVSLVNPIFSDGQAVRYDDCCLTNGNQTRFIILILSLLKLLSRDGKLRDITKQEYQSFIKEHFDDSESLRNIVNYIKYPKVTQMVKFLRTNSKYLESFSQMHIEEFLNARIRILVNVIDSIIEDIDDKLDSYQAGTLIAEANNDTQNVKVDDIFGTKHKDELNERIFKYFKEIYENEVKIEFRYGEIVDKGKKVHILTLLRPVLATGILTKEGDIFRFTNQRIPVYNLFEKLIHKSGVDKTICAVSKLIPLLYKIRYAYVQPHLEELKRNLTREYQEKAVLDGLSDTIIGTQISKVRNNDSDLERLIRTNIKYNIDHILPVLVYKIKSLFKERDGRLDLTIPEEEREKFFGAITEAIYRNYIEIKLQGLPTSLTTVVRNRKFYESGDEAYRTYKKMSKFEETSYIAANSHVIR